MLQSTFEKKNEGVQFHEYPDHVEIGNKQPPNSTAQNDAFEQEQ